MDQKEKHFSKSKNTKIHNKKHTGKKMKKKVSIDINTDERFEDFTKPEKQPPVDMYGRQISPGALDNYISSSDDEIEVYIPDDAKPSEDEEVPTSKDIFRRLAVVNQPWKDIKAQDIFQYFYMNLDDHSDDLISVKVYLSRYGQENPETPAPPPTDSEEIENARWRKRGEDELKRYFAIAEFKDAYTADIIYKLMENVGIDDDEGSSFDLRFVSDDQEFDDFPIRDEANAPISDWDPPKIYTPFLSKTKNNDKWDSASRDRQNAFDVMWDEDEDNPEREIAEEMLIGNGSEDEEVIKRSALQGMIDHINNDEEEEENEYDSETNYEFKLDLVQEKEKNQPSEKVEFDVPKKHKKSKKKIDEISPEKDEDTVKEVMEDDRFKDLFSREGYGIDNSDPNFKRTPLMDKFMTEVTKKHLEANKGKDQAQENKNDDPHAGFVESAIERMKRRAANANKK